MDTHKNMDKSKNNYTKSAPSPLKSIYYMIPCISNARKYTLTKVSKKPRYF